MGTPGKRLKQAREALGITQKELGSRVGLHWYQVKDLETGKVKNLSLSLAKALEEKLGINSEWLATGEGEMFKEASPLFRVAEQAIHYPSQIQHQNKVAAEHIELAELTRRIINYLESASVEERQTVRRLMEGLASGSEEIRHHLIGQLKLIEQLPNFKKKNPSKERTKGSHPTSQDRGVSGRQGEH